MAKVSGSFDPDSAFKTIIGIKGEVEVDVNPDEIKLEELKKEDENFLVVAKKKEEKRNKSVHVLIKPSIHLRAQKKCKKIGVSLNECINQLIEKWINE